MFPFQLIVYQTQAKLRSEITLSVLSIMYSTSFRIGLKSGLSHLECQCHDPGAQQLDDKLYYKLRSTDATSTTFYGLPKIHKPEVPLRPITSSINCPIYQASKYLASILSPLQCNQFTVTNSNDFVRKISNCTTA